MDFSKLRGRITEKYGKENRFAEAMDMSPRTLSMKLNSIREFKPSEIVKALEKLELPVEEVGPYFFTLKVQ